MPKKTRRRTSVPKKSPTSYNAKARAIAHKITEAIKHVSGVEFTSHQQEGIEELLSSKFARGFTELEERKVAAMALREGVSEDVSELREIVSEMREKVSEMREKVPERRETSSEMQALLPELKVLSMKIQGLLRHDKRLQHEPVGLTSAGWCCSFVV